MHPLLSTDREHYAAILRDAASVAEAFVSRQDTIAPGRYVASLPPAPLPRKGIGAQNVLRLFEERYSGLVSGSAGPRYFGFVTGGSTPAAVAADWLVSAYDQNACGSNDSVAPLIEKQAIGFLRELFGLDPGHFGTFVTGATISNFVGLALARQWVGEQQGVDISNEGTGDVPVRIISGTPHSSVLKSLSMLGIGRNALSRCRLLPQREAVDINALEDMLRESSGPAVVVANAGTVNTVDFDDLTAIASLKLKYNFWLHVDAAFGGFAAASERFRHLVSGLNLADSITIDAHKWMNVPYDAAMQFTRHRDLQLKVFQNSAAYLGDPLKSPDFFHYTPENSRRWRALPVWFSLMAYGVEGLREIVERNCAAATTFGNAVAASSAFTLLAPVRMNVVCFTFRNEDERSVAAVQQFLNDVRDDGKVYFTPTVYANTPAIRAAISNWQTGENDVRIALDAIERVYRRRQTVIL